MPFRGDRGRPGPGWEDGTPDALVAELSALAGSLDPTPSDPRVSATRASILGAFAAAGAMPGTALRADRAPAHRPALALLLAAALLAAVSIGAAASTAGLPLYGLRLAVEELVLPDSPALRDVAQLDRLDERLREAVAAAAAGDGGALRASLGEYARIAESVAATAGPDVVALSRVRQQLATLDGLAFSDPLGEAERMRARAAAMKLMRAFGGTDDPAPSPPVTPAPSSAPASGGMPSPGGPGPSMAPGPGGSGGPPASSGPHGSGDPGGGGEGPNPTGDPGRGGSGSGGTEPASGSGGTDPGSGSGDPGAGGPGPAPTNDPGREAPGSGSGDPGSGDSGSGGPGSGGTDPSPGGAAPAPSPGGAAPAPSSGPGSREPAPSAGAGSGDPGAGSGGSGDDSGSGSGSDDGNAAVQGGEQPSTGG